MAATVEREQMASPEVEMSGLVIDCSECLENRTEACDDCIVAFVIDRPEGAVVFDAAEERALRSLHNAGLLPELRYGRKTG